MKCGAVKKGKEKPNFVIANNGISKTQKCLHDEVTNEENVDHFLLRQGSYSVRIPSARSNSRSLTRLNKTVGRERPVFWSND
jgi:hypothetical protein